MTNAWIADEWAFWLYPRPSPLVGPPSPANATVKAEVIYCPQANPSLHGYLLTGETKWRRDLRAYPRAARMTLNRGKYGGERILSRLSVEPMTSDHISSEQKAALPFVPGFWDSRGWGFGLFIITKRDDVAAVPGRFGWDGGLGT